MVRERGLGNSATQLQHQIEEQHSENWLHQVEKYLANCSITARCAVIDAAQQFKEPPPMRSVPKYQWMLSVYAKDVFCHALTPPRHTLLNSWEHSQNGFHQKGT